MNRLSSLFPLAALRRHALLLFTLLLSAPLPALTSGNFTYSVSNGQATITDFPTDYSGDLTIPSTLGDYPVTAIGYQAFYKCSSLTSVTIPSSVTSIGGYAFYNCSSLTSVTIPSSVTSIGSSAFYHCDSLTSVTIPEGVTTISSSAFEGCSSLTSVTIPEGVTSIGNYAFEYCSSLTSVTIPEGVTTIGDRAFSSCSSLVITVSADNASYASLDGCLFNKDYSTLFAGPGVKDDYVIPLNVTTIGDDAFRGCSSLTSVTIPEGVTSIGDRAFSGCSSLVITVSADNASYASLDGCLFNKDYSTFLAAPGVTNDYVIPSGVTTIGSYAFYGCSSLTSVTIPSSVVSIGYWAFARCSSLTSVTIPSSVTSIENGAFEGVAPKTLVASCVPSGMSKEKLTSVTIPEGVTTISDYAFSGCSSLTSVVIPSSVTTIGRWAFSSCSSLTSVTISEGVTSIGDYAFEDCSSLTSVMIPSSVTSIGADAFSDCSVLTSVTISEGVTSIGDWAFSWCRSLTSVTIPEGVTSIGDEAFRGCRSLVITVSPGNASYASLDGCLFNKDYSKLLAAPGVTGHYVIPSSVTSIGSSAFADCRSLTSVTIPEGVTSIGDYAFRYCRSLTSVTISEGVTTIGYSAFEFCSSLTSVTIPEGVTSIGSYAFLFCRSLTSVTIPESVTSIGYDAFEGCSSLPTDENGIQYESQEKRVLIVVPESLAGEFVISSSVRFVHSSAFYGCRSLTSVTMPEGVTSIGDDAFYRCTSLTSVTIPSSVTSIGDEAFSGCSSLTSVTIPEGVTSIGNYAFYYCSSLTSVTISEGVTSIGDYAFGGCSSLSSVTIHEGVTSIGDWAFEGCSALTSVTIPSSVTSIGGYAFDNCSSLTSVTFSGKPFRAQASTFPAGVKGYYPAAYAVEWEAVIVDGKWNGLVMTCAEAEEKPSVPGDEGATIEGSAEAGWVVKPSEGVGEIVVSIPEGVEAAKVTVEVPSTATSVTANGAAVKVVKVIGNERHDITNFLDFPAAVAGKVDLTQAEVKTKIAEQILDTSESGGAVFDPLAEQPLTTAETKPGLTYILLEGDSLDSLTEGERKVGDGQPWTPNPTKRGSSAFYRIRITK